MIQHALPPSSSASPLAFPSLPDDRLRELGLHPAAAAAAAAGSSAASGNGTRAGATNGEVKATTNGAIAEDTR